MAEGRGFNAPLQADSGNPQGSSSELVSARAMPSSPQRLRSHQIILKEREIEKIDRAVVI